MLFPLSPAAALVSVCALSAATPDWKEAPALAADPAQIQAAFAKVPARAGFPVSELLEDSFFSVDAAGKRSSRYRYIFRIDQASAIESWSTVTMGWTSWFEEKPSIQARVITPDGREHRLDPATIGEFSPEQNSPELFTDHRQLKAPLPRLEKGAIVEVEIKTQEHRPFSPAGVRGSLSLWQSVPVQQTIAVLEVPAGAPLKWKLNGLPGIQPKVQTTAGRTRLTIELGPTMPPAKGEANEVPDEHLKPSLTYGTTPDWNKAATEYLALVEQQMKGTDLKAWVQETLQGAQGREESLRRIVAALHKRVRYTGLEFGEASIVPRPPAETLRRGYGDCKDKATLLLALLREAGIPAHLALLRTGPGLDYTPEIPGLSAFDHVIVYLPGPTPLWIDATVPTALPGELPIPDLDRNALVISADTLTVLKTPTVTAAQNQTRETMEVFLATEGPGRVLETTAGSGPSGIGLRGEYLGVDPKRTRENLKDYVDRIYKTKEMGRLEYEGADDLSRPFSLVVEALKSPIARTALSDAAVGTNPWPLVEALSNALQPGKPEEDTSDSGTEPKPAETKKETPRRSAFQFAAPYSREARWIVHVPQGFAHDALPASRTLMFGPARLTQTYSAQPDGTIQAVYAFDSGPQRWTAAQVNEARTAIKAFGEEKIPMLVFQQVGEALLSEGKIKEALVEFRKLQAQQPDKAAPMIRLARAQLAGGLGESARETARKATRTEATSALSFQTLGWILQHDLIGRRFKPGWDRAGAISAYRKAIALDPKNRDARMDLAILHEFDEHGERYAPGTELPEAIKLYRALEDEEKNDTVADNLMVCLARCERFQEAHDLALARQPGARRDGWLVAMKTCTKGLETALAESRQIFQDLATRRAAFLNAADVLVNYRRYAEASRLLNEGASGNDKMAQIRARADLMAKTTRYETRVIDPKDPRAPVIRLLQLTGYRHPKPEQILECYSEAQRAGLKPEAGLEAMKELRSAFTKQGVAPEVASDLALSLSEFSLDGDADTGYRVRATLFESATATFLIAEQKGTYRIAGTTGDLVTIGREVLWQTDHDNLKAARSALDYVVNLVRGGDDKDPLYSHPLRRLWEKGSQGTLAEIRQAGASMTVYDATETKGLKILQEAQAASLPASKTGAIQQALYIAMIRKQDFAASEKTAEALFAAHPTSKIARRLRGASLLSARKWSEALRFIDAELAKDPDDSDLMDMKPTALFRAGHVQDSEDFLVKQIARGKASPGDFNNLAWDHVARGMVDSRTLEYARKGTQGTGERSAAAAHTLATVLAELGRTAEARETILREIGMSDKDQPRGADWFTLGRIAESLGELDAAIACYQKVTPEENEPADDPRGCLVLAKRRLAGLTKPSTGNTLKLKL